MVLSPANTSSPAPSLQRRTPVRRIGPVVLFSRWNDPSDAFARVTLTLARGLVQTGVDGVTVAVICGSDCAAPEVPEGVHLVTLEASRLRWAPIELARLLRQIRPRVLISMPSTASIFAYLATRLAGKDRPKLVINQADTLFSEVSIEHSWNLNMRLLTRLARFVYPRSDALVATTADVMDILNRNGVHHERTAIIANPVDAELIELSAHDVASTHASLLSPDLPNVVSLGRLVRRKNFSLLLRAMRVLQSRGVQARLVIIGDGPDEAALRRRAKALGLKDVVIAGFVENAWSVLAHADLFVMSSDDEAFCLALAEAMALGVPVVSTDAIGGGPRTLLRDGELAPLVPRNDPAALANAIAGRLAQGPNVRDTSVARDSLSRFAPRTIATQWIELIESLDEGALDQLRLKIVP